MASVWKKVLDATYLDGACRNRRNFTNMMQTTKVQDVQKAIIERNARTTRQVGPDSHKWLLAQDMAKEKRKRDIVDDWDAKPTFILGTISLSRITLASPCAYVPGDSTACASPSRSNCTCLH